MQVEDYIPFSVATRLKILRAIVVLFFLSGVAAVLYGATLLLQAQQVYGTTGEELVSCPSTYSPQTETEPAKMITAISGGVHNPGMYSLPQGARIGDIIQAAGGLSAEADSAFISNALNLAKPISDGEGVYIPTQQDTEVTTACHAFLSYSVKTEHQEGTEESAGGGLLSINTASADELDTLPGIGEKRAEAIIEGRPYTSLSELVADGIVTESVFLDIESLIQL